MKRIVVSGKLRLEYSLTRQSRSDVLIKTLPEGVTKVYAPKHVHLRDVDDLIRARAADIFRMHSEVEQKWAENRAQNALLPGRMLWIQGEQYELAIRQGKPGVCVEGGQVVVTGANAGDEDAIRAQLRAYLSGLALGRIRERLEYFIPRVGKSPGRITIREQKTRWGSCSSKQNLNFNWKLIMAPPPVLDYVVVHELCHLHEFNHSEKFWKLVGEQMPEYLHWKKWLKSHGSQLTL